MESSKYYYNLRSSSWFVLNEGKIVRNIQDDGQANNEIIGIDAKGNLKYYGTGADSTTKKQIANNILSDNVRNTFSFGPYLINNSTIVGGGAQYAHRQAICQLNTNNYVMLTTINKITITKVAEIFKNIGCITAFNLDGGGSTSLFYKTNNETKAKKFLCRDGDTGDICRTIIEGIYFVEK